MKQLVFPRTLVFFCLIFVFATLPASHSFADMIIEIRDSTIAAGQPGRMDVMISSNSGDMLAAMNYVLQITIVGAPAGTLEFATQAPSTSNSDPNYVFATDLDPFGLLIDTPTTADLEAGDYTSSGNGVTLSGAPKLLFRMDLSHVLGPGQTEAQAAGEQFEVTMVLGGGTFFLDELGNDLAIDLGASKLTGTMTVAAVPEPSSIILTTLGLGGCLGVVRKRRRSSRLKSRVSSQFK